MSIWSAIKDGINAINPINAISSIFSTAGDVYNNERNIDLQKDTNKLNYQIFQEGNEFNAEQALLQRRFESEEAYRSRYFNAQEALKNRNFQTSEREAAQAYNEMMYNKYESPQAMAAQYIAAGLNPAAASGQQGNLPSSVPASGAQASSSPVSGAAASAGSVGSLQAPKAFANPFETFVNSLTAINNSFSQSGLNDAQAAILRIDGETRRQENIERIQKLIADKEKALSDEDLNYQQKENLETDLKIAKENLEILQRSKEFFVAQNEHEATIKSYEAKIAYTNYVMNEFRMNHQQETYDLEMKLGKANIENLYASASSALQNAYTNFYNARTGRLELKFNKQKFKKEFLHQVDMDSRRIALEATDVDTRKRQARVAEKRQQVDASVANQNISESKQRIKQSKQEIKESRARIEKMYVDAATDVVNSITNLATGMFGMF